MKTSKKPVRRLLSILMIFSMVFIAACSSNNETPVVDPVVTPDAGKTVEKKPVSVEAPQFNYNDSAAYATNDFLKVALNCPTSGAKIYFAVDNKDNFSAYGDPIKINTDSVIYAYAELDGTKSPVVSAKYRVAKAGLNIDDFENDYNNARVIYNDSDYTFKNWDDHLVCRLDDYDGSAGYFFVSYESLGNDPQFSFAYVEGSDWHEVYNCIALSNKANQLVIPFDGGDVRNALFNEIHLMGQQVTVYTILFIPRDSAIDDGPGFMEGVQLDNLDAFRTWYEDGNLDGCSVTLNSDGTWNFSSHNKFLEGTFVGFGASAELYTYDGCSFATASPRGDVLYLTLSGEIENYFDTLEGDIVLMKEEDSEHKESVYIADYDNDAYFIGTWLCYDPENECVCDYGFELRTDGTYMDYPADSFSWPHSYDIEDEAIFVFDDDGEILYTYYFDETIEPRCLFDDGDFLYFAQ